MALFIYGCGSSSKQSTVDVPSWILTPVADTSDYFYGVGEGYDIESAKRAALRDVAGKLRVSISGTMQSELSVRNEQINRQVVDRVSMEIQRIDFSRYEVVKVDKTGQGIAVLVQVDRQAFISETEDKLSELDKDIRLATDKLSSQTPLNQFVNLLAVRNKVLSARSYAQILIGARSSATRDPRIANYEGLLNRADRAAHDLLVEVRARPEDNDLVIALSTLITDSGAKVVPSVGSNGVVLTLDSSQITNFFQGSHMVTMQVLINTQDVGGRLVSTKRHELVGASITDQKSARLNAIRKWSEKIKTTGLIPSLGLAR